MKTFLIACCLALSLPGYAQVQPSDATRTLVQSLTAGESSNEGKTRKMVQWLNRNLTWTYTDYQKRTPEQILERRAGNCAELASVLAAMLKADGIPFRWISEINIQQRSEDRQKTAAEKIAASGIRMSVFGLMHNDHVWLEVGNEKDGSWFPADPAAGVVGMDEWINSRMLFTQRRISPIPDVADTLAGMYAPVAVVASDRRGGVPAEIRSVFYLIEGFNAHYQGKLAALPAWAAWQSRVESFAPVASGAFASQVNLHQNQAQIEGLWQTYQQLRAEAAAAGI